VEYDEHSGRYQQAQEIDSHAERRSDAHLFECLKDLTCATCELLTDAVSDRNQY